MANTIGLGSDGIGATLSPTFRESLVPCNAVERVSFRVKLIERFTLKLYWDLVYVVPYPQYGGVTKF